MQKLGTVVCVGALLTWAAALPAHAQDPSPPYELRSRADLCLQPEGGMNSWNGAIIRQMPCDPSDPSQLWTPKVVSTYPDRTIARIENAATHLCLDLTDGNTADGTPLQQWECNLTSNTMLWALDATAFGIKFVNGRSGKCMDRRGGSFLPGTVIQNYHCADLPNGRTNFAQRFDWTER